MRILYVVHAIPPLDFSGTPLIAHQYAAVAARSGNEVAIAFARPSGGQAIPPPDGVQLLPLAAAPERPWTLTAFSTPPKRDEATLTPLRQFHPDVVHVVDWVNLPSSLLAALKALKVPVVRQVWNCEDVCAFIEPIRFNPDYRLCRGPFGPEQCGECLVRRLGTIRANLDAPIDQAIAKLTEARAAMKADFTTKVTAKRRAFAGHLKDSYDALVFPCASFARYFAAIADLGSIPQRVIEHGIPPPDPRPSPPPRPAGTPLRCVFLGPCNGRKGWDLVERCFTRLLPEFAGRLTLKVAGGRALAATTPLANLPGIELLDPFPSSSLAAVLADCDLGLVPSPFETFSRVCREMLAHGLPVIGSDAFGIPDAVVDGVNGLLIGEPSVDGLTAAVRRLLGDDSLRANLAAGADATPLRSPEAEFAELSELYRSLMTGRKRSR